MGVFKKVKEKIEKIKPNFDVEPKGEPIKAGETIEAGEEIPDLEVPKGDGVKNVVIRDVSEAFNSLKIELEALYATKEDVSVEIISLNEKFEQLNTKIDEIVAYIKSKDSQV